MRIRNSVSLAIVATTTLLLTLIDCKFAFAAPPAILGDFNVDGIANAADAVVWANALGTPTVLPNENGNGIADAADLDLLIAHLGEPGSADTMQATLIYSALNGHVTLDQSNAVGGKITAFYLMSSTNALVAPGTATFPYQTLISGISTFKDTAAQIGQINIANNGLPTTQFLLGPVLPAGLNLSQLQTALNGTFYMSGGSSSGRTSFNLVRIVPEPATALLAALAFGICLNRRRLPAKT